VIGNPIKQHFASVTIPNDCTGGNLQNHVLTIRTFATLAGTFFAALSGDSGQVSKIIQPTNVRVNDDKYTATFSPVSTGWTTFGNSFFASPSNNTTATIAGTNLQTNTIYEHTNTIYRK
jgi:hypothetical protein